MYSYMLFSFVLSVQIKLLYLRAAVRYFSATLVTLVLLLIGLKNIHENTRKLEEIYYS